jgi:alpha-L-rhamnosidase/Glycosyl hydrolases family 2, sugar binding domain
MNLSQVLGAEGLQPDFAYVKNYEDASVKFYHRHADGTDIYFVNNRTDQAAAINAEFRVTGKTAEIWSADRGTIRPASYRIHDGVTTVPLSLTARDAVFVVFREPTTVLSRVIPEPVRTMIAEVRGEWTVDFQPGRGAPDSVKFVDLSDWSNSSDTGIKYFSGTATYTKTIDVPESALDDGARVELDLGKVHEIAEVAVNGQTEGIAWKPPYSVDITDAVKAGKNTLSIKVVNLWPNRLIGDMQKGAKKYAFAPNSTYTENSQLFPSGLIGPVVINRVAAVNE